MPAFKAFAVAGGSGNLGSKLVEELAASGFEVKVLSRTPYTPTTQGVKAVVVDYEKEEGLRSAFEGVDVVINALGGEAGINIDVEKRLSKAAKTAGAQLYVASRWSGDLDTIQQRNDLPVHALIQHRLALPEYLEKELQLPWIAFNTGLFSTFVGPAFSIDVGAQTARVVGKGETPFASTSLADIARFVALAFTKLPASDLHNRALNVAGKTYSVKQILADISKTTNKDDDWKVEHVPVEEARKVASDVSLGLASFILWVGLGVETGALQLPTGDSEALGFQPKDTPVDAFLASK